MDSNCRLAVAFVLYFALHPLGGRPVLVQRVDFTAGRGGLVSAIAPVGR